MSFSPEVFVSVIQTDCPRYIRALNPPRAAPTFSAPTVARAFSSASAFRQVTCFGQCLGTLEYFPIGRPAFPLAVQVRTGPRKLCGSRQRDNCTVKRVFTTCTNGRSDRSLRQTETREAVREDFPTFATFFLPFVRVAGEKSYTIIPRFDGALNRVHLCLDFLSSAISFLVRDSSNCSRYSATNNSPIMCYVPLSRSSSPRYCKPKRESISRSRVRKSGKRRKVVRGLYCAPRAQVGSGSPVFLFRGQLKF